MPIPLTVIGGFLGAGKTTLVNALLRSAEKRWGVLVNDFGAVNIDAALIAEQDGGTIALTNGCVCCAMGDDLGDALAQLAARVPPPEHVIVEASGVGDPWRIAQLALIEPGFTLEPLVVLANAEAIAAQLADRWTGDTVRRQLAFAEIVLLTRTDLAPAAPAEAIAREIRPQAVVRAAPHGALPPDALGFTPPPRAPASRFAADAPPPFRAWLWTPPGPLCATRLRGVLGELPPAVLRVKGFCRLGERPQLLQYAAERWAFTDAPATAAEGLVVIGTPEMDEPALAAAFAASAL